jgi:hypothetical protein
MERITADFPDATLFSLPSVGGEGCHATSSWA